MEKIIKFNTDVVARLFAAFCLAYPPLAAYTIPTSVSGRIHIGLGEFTSITLFSVMFSISLLIIADVVLNSLSDRPRWKWVTKIRDTLYMVAAFCTIIVPFTASQFSEVDIAICFLYLVIFSVFASLSWCDSSAKKDSIPQRGKS